VTSGEARQLRTRGGRTARLPLFLPVYQPRLSALSSADWAERFGVEGCIVNAFLLYKDRAMRRRFEQEGLELHQLLGFEGLVMTDSGAFQGFRGPLYLHPERIVEFQDASGADVISPLDLVTPPGDNRRDAESKLEATLKRYRAARPLAGRSTLAAVQQGGRFPALRERALDALLETGVEYLALGSLVPFFNRGHDLRFVGPVIEAARARAGRDVPIHVYGAGDPVELPFLVALGADIFDSSSYVHYARKRLYMTPYGAIPDPESAERAAFRCDCAACTGAASLSEVLADEPSLIAHNLATILGCVRTLRESLAEGSLDALLARTLEIHAAWFPESRLPGSWKVLRG
jgi:7-cyano-7-deazaguanine tRNA-ribosyltransferase